MKKRLLSTLLALCMALTLLPTAMFAAGTVASGNCGDDSNGGNGENLTWSLTADGVLTISGSGRMKNYVDYSWGAAPWSSYRPNISQIQIGSGVTSIGAFAFRECENLISVSLPNSLGSIGSYAFDNCCSLTNVIIPNSVTSIGRGAFNFCYSLTSIAIPDGITTIDESTFAWCTSLTNITIPKSVTSIGYNAFEACSSLTRLTVPVGVTSIGGGAFDTCSSLTSITIPDGVTKIEERTFRGCAGLTRINIPDNVTNIGEYAFYACEGLTSIIIPNNVTSIGAYAYEHCTGLTDVTIPNSMTNIEHHAFNLCINLSDAYFNGSEVQWKQISIGNYNNPLHNANIHYASDGSDPNSGGIVIGGPAHSLDPDLIPDVSIYPDTGTGSDITAYTHFGKLDSYDHNGSAVIDGVKYKFSEKFKNSSPPIGPLSSGDYMDNYVYALYSLNAEKEITALKYDDGVICKLEGWDAVNSVVDTDRLDIAGPGGFQLGLKSGDYRVSDIVKKSFPTAQIGNWIGDDIRIYTDRQTIYKVIHVEHKSGTVTAFDALSKPQHVYIDNTACSITENSELVETIRRAQFSKVAYILYDNCVVEVLSKEQLEPSLSMGLAMNASIKYKNGTYERASTSIENTLTIQITNKITFDYSINKALLESISAFDIKMVSLKVTSTNPAMVVFSNGSDKYIHTSLSNSNPIHAGGNYHFSIPFKFNNAHVPREGEQASFVCEFVIVGTSGETITLRQTAALTVIEVDSRNGNDSDSSNSDLESMRSDLEKNTAITLTPDVLQQYFTAKEIKSMERFLTVYMAQMINVPKVEEDEGFFKELTKKVRSEVKQKLYSAMKINEKTDLVGVNQLSTTVTVKGAKASVEFDIATSKYLLDGNVFSALSYVRYKIVGTNKQGVGIITYTNFENFCDSMMRYIKSGYDLAWGKDADKVAEAFLSKPIYNLLAKDGSFSNRVFTLLSISAKTAFSDVASDSYYSDAVAWAVDSGVTNGTSNTAFSPSADCTRAQIVTFLWRAYGSPEPKSTSSFADVSSHVYYTKAVQWAVEQGITTGATDSTFNPDRGCTRAQAMTFLWRANGSPTVSGSNFIDVPSGKYYADAIAWAAANGVSTGYADGTFAPDNTCTRGNIITFLYRDMVD